MGINEKDERRELLAAVADAGRLARGLDQLPEPMAHADQLDPLDVEGILALRSISERCAGRIGDASRIPEAQNKVFMPRGKSLLSTPPVEKERSALGGEAVALPAPPLRFRQAPGIGGALDQLSPLMVSSSSTM